MHSTGSDGSIRSMASGYVRMLTRRLLAAAIAGLVVATIAVNGARQGELVSIILWLVVWVTVFGLVSGLLLWLVARRAPRAAGPASSPGGTLDAGGRIPVEVGVVFAAASLAGVWVGSVGLCALIATAFVAALDLDGFVAAVAWIAALVGAFWLTRIVLSAVSYTTMIAQIRGLTGDDSVIGRARSASAVRRARPVTDAEGEGEGDAPAALGDSTPMRVVSPEPDDPGPTSTRSSAGH